MLRLGEFDGVCKRPEKTDQETKISQFSSFDPSAVAVADRDGYTCPFRFVSMMMVMWKWWTPETRPNTHAVNWRTPPPPPPPPPLAATANDIRSQYQSDTSHAHAHSRIWLGYRVNRESRDRALTTHHPEKTKDTIHIPILFLPKLLNTLLEWRDVGRSLDDDDDVT